MQKALVSRLGGLQYFELSDTCHQILFEVQMVQRVWLFSSSSNTLPLVTSTLSLSSTITSVVRISVPEKAKPAELEC